MTATRNVVIKAPNGTGSYVPIDLAAKCWEAIREEAEFSTLDLRTRAGLSKLQADKLMKIWMSEGAIRFVRKEGGYRLHRATEGFSRPMPSGRTPEDNMWAAVRRLPVFSAIDVAVHATTAVLKVTERHAQDYLQALLLAGYIRVQRTARPGVRPALYSANSGAGPLAPRVRRIRAVEDPNSGKVHIIEGGMG